MGPFFAFKVGIFLLLWNVQDVSQELVSQYSMTCGSMVCVGLQTERCFTVLMMHRIASGPKNFHQYIAKQLL